MGILLTVDVTKVESGDAAPVASDGPTFTVFQSQSDTRLAGTGGQIVFSALSETSGAAIGGTFDGIIAKASGSSDVIKVTNGVFHATVP